MNYLSHELDAWGETLRAVHLPRWHELPEFELYMDQVLTFVNTHLAFIRSHEDDKLLTPAMINNYVKLKLIPKPVKKRYTKVHLAYLIIIVLLKPVLSISDIRCGINLQVAAFHGNYQKAYDLYCKQQEKTLHHIADLSQNRINYDQVISDKVPAHLQGTYMATLSLASKIFAEKVLEIIELNASDDAKDIPSF